MRITPVKTRPISRRIWVKLRMWEVGLRMKEVHGNPDVWFLESQRPSDDSPWEQTQVHGRSFARLSSVSVSQLAKAEGELRLELIHDYFAGLRAVARTRCVYSLYVVCRSTIEACAFTTWVYNPRVQPGERILRGLLLREQSLKQQLKLLRVLEQGHSGKYAGDREYTATAKIEVKHHLCKTELAIQGISTGLESTMGPELKRSRAVPNKTDRIRELLIDELDLPQGLDAYRRLSGVAHSDSLAIVQTWNSDKGKPSIDYYDFLVYFHLALCSINFSLAQRASCWGATHNSSGLDKIVDRVERIIDKEPGVEML